MTVTLGTLPIALLVLGLVVALRVVRTRPGFRRTALDRFARRVDLTVTDELRPHVEAALLSRNLAVDLGSAAGIVILGLVGWAVDGSEGALAGDGPIGSFGPVIVVGSALAGAAIGAAVSGVRQARRRANAAGPRLARVSAPTYGDYVAPLELSGARLAALAPAALLILGLAVSVLTDVMSVRELVTGWALVTVAVPLAVLVASEAAGRHLLDLPQAAGSSLELAWNDAIRARILRDIVTAPLAIGVYATFVLLVLVGGSVQNDIVTEVVVPLIGLGSALALVVVAVVSSADRPQRHFRRQLWPDPVTAGTGPDAGGGPASGGAR